MGQRPILKPRCAHCRRRKIKCDYERPKCGNCVRVNRECIYESNITIVAYEPPTSGDSHARQQRQRAPLQPLTQTAGLDSGIQASQHGIGEPRAHDDSDREQYYYSHGGNQALPYRFQHTFQHTFKQRPLQEDELPGSQQKHHKTRTANAWPDYLLAVSARRSGVSEAAVSLHNAAHRQGMRDQFYDRFLPLQKTSWDVAQTWLDSWMAIQDTNGLAYMAIHSMHVQTMAQELGDSAKLHTALSTQAKLLRSLGKHLSAANTVDARAVAFATSATILMTDVVLLGVPERIKCGSHEGSMAWLTHVPGVTGCLEAMGPKELQNPAIHHIYRAVRAVIMSAHVYEDKDTILSLEKWKTIPFEKTTKDLYDTLNDVLLDLPPILSAAKRAIDATSLPEQEEAIEDFVRAEAVYTASSDQWAADVEAAFGHKIAALRRVPAFLTLMLPHMTLGDAVGVMMYYSGILSLHNVARRIVQAKISIPEAHRESITKAADVDAFLPVVQIIVLVGHHCNRPANGIVGKIHVGIGMVTLGKFFRDLPDQAHSLQYKELVQSLHDEGYNRLAVQSGYVEEQEPA